MSNDMYYSLLDDPLISVRYKNDEVRKSTLPEIFTALLKDNVIGFEALQPHQHQAWFSFLVQLAAMAVARESDGKIPKQPDTWRSILMGLAEGSEAAWHLVVEDVSKPAFMQSPVPEGSLEEAGYKSDIRTPDELDMLVTSKNHDLKGNRILRPEPEHWLYALLTLQTMEGIMGRGNYGIVRMNSGYGNRPFIGISPKLSWGERTQRDLNVLLTYRKNLLDIYKSTGHALIWLSPWDGDKDSAIRLSECDPFFLEICRRIRFLNSENNIQCYHTNTKGSRILAPDDLNGKTGDPWTPIEKKEAKSLSVSEQGFTYELLQELLLGTEYSKPVSMEFQEKEHNEMYLIAKTLVRGMGKTHGLHQRIIPIPSRVTKLFKEETEKELIAKRAQERVALTSDVQSKILNRTIRLLLSSGSEQQIDYGKVAPWINRFTQNIDDRFFESLWASIDMDSDEAQKQWQLILFEEAQKILNEAERSIPIANLRRLRTVSQARSIFYGRCRDVLELAWQEKISTKQTEEQHEYEDEI